MIVHASVISKDVYNGRIVPCNPTEYSYKYTARMVNVTCEKCQKYIAERAKKEGIDPETFMKIW